MNGFKKVWLLGCGLRLEAYEHVDDIYLCIPLYGTVKTKLSLSFVQKTYGDPDLEG